uniref:DUF4220 domain-containing protein n=1 Tax=Oryza punctata TaxID=4537 RepID=A0A0E0JEI0_ORYPU
MASLMQVWDEWEMQSMVLLSFMLQLFLLLTGRLRRRSINSLLRLSIWLAYVGADLVAVYALGLFSHYEKKYISGRHSFEDTLPLLWVPFLLVHLGGQDSITAFSIEDNNLWLRHLLNLGIQGTLSLYVFWKSVYRINSRVLITAAFVFISGIIKYGERTWALRSGSRDGLVKSSMRSSTPEQSNRNDIHSSMGRASYALQTVLLARGLFVGRTVLQLGHGVQEKYGYYFEINNQVLEAEDQLKMLAMELGMMFDLLYTKAMVLQSRVGWVFRCGSQVFMVVAFILFLQAEKHGSHNHSSVNVAISYTLFVGAIFIEVCSVAMVLASPWTWTHLKEGTFLYRLSRNAGSHLKAIKCINNCMRWLSSFSIYSIGHFNHIDFTISHASTSRVTNKIISVLDLRKQWYMKQVEAKGIFQHMVEWFGRSPEQRFGRLEPLGRKLNYTLCLPFEHAIYRLHIYTDLHISKHSSLFSSSDATTQRNKEVCEKLSNYMKYLVAAYPSMLPVSSAVVIEPVPAPADDLRNRNRQNHRLWILENEAARLVREPDSASPFDSEEDLNQSLEEIKEMWTRMLVYAAGKCGGELHARQLGDELELLTFVWLLMIHHGLGDAATEVKLLTSDDPRLPELGSLVADGGSNWRPWREQPRYAFNFCRRQGAEIEAGGLSSMSRERDLLSIVRTMEMIVPRIMQASGSVIFEAYQINGLLERFLSSEIDTSAHSEENGQDCGGDTVQEQ